MTTQNIYDEEPFFTAYSQLERSMATAGGRSTIVARIFMGYSDTTVAHFACMAAGCSAQDEALPDASTTQNRLPSGSARMT